MLCNRKDLVTLVRESSFLLHKRSVKDTHIAMRNFIAQNEEKFLPIAQTHTLRKAAGLQGMGSRGIFKIKWMFLHKNKMAMEGAYGYL